MQVLVWPARANLKYGKWRWEGGNFSSPLTVAAEANEKLGLADQTTKYVRLHIVPSVPWRGGHMVSMISGVREKAKASL